MIRLQEATSLAGSVGRLLLGLAACVVMGVIAATLATSLFYVVAGTSLIGWKGWFGVYLIVLVPYLIWQERRSRDDYLTHALRSIDPEPSSRGEHELDRAGLQIAIYASWLVWGPRALIDGVRGMRGLRTATQHAVFDRAGALVVRLSKAPGRVEIKKLLNAPEDMRIFGSAVDLLDKHGWIGKASDGDSLWLNSTFRNKLLGRTGKS